MRARPPWYRLDREQQIHPFHQRTMLEFRVEAFNVLNATNYEYPDSAITDGANFGAYSSAVVYPSRQVQLALRLAF